MGRGAGVTILHNNENLPVHSAVPVQKKLLRNLHTEVVIASNFNRHNPLWGRSYISSALRQEESGPIIDFMGVVVAPEPLTDGGDYVHKRCGTYVHDRLSAYSTWIGERSGKVFDLRGEVSIDIPLFSR